MPSLCRQIVFYCNFLFIIVLIEFTKEGIPMENTISEKRLKLLKEILTMPKEYRNSFVWLINNIDFVKEMCSKNHIPSDELEKSINTALNNNDIHLYVILLFYKALKYK